MRKAVETGAGEIRLGEAKGRGSKGKSRKEKRGKSRKKRRQWRLRKWQKNGKSEMMKKWQQDQKRKQRRWCQKSFTVDQGIWEETIRKDANEEDVGSCDKSEGGVCAKEGKGLPIIKGRKRGSKRVHLGAAEERVHLTIKITADNAGILCGEKGWKKESSLELSVSE